MKAFIALLICIAAVFGESEFEKTIKDQLKDASNACVREMNRDPRFISDEGPPNDPCILEDPNFVLCLDKKMGLMKADGTYSLEYMMSFAETPESRKKAEEIYNTKMKECSSKAGNDACKMVACVRKLSESMCGKKPRKEDGC